MGKGWEGGSTWAWRKLRRSILERDSYRCQIKVEGVCTTIATAVHHTAGKAITGDDPRYLVAACAPCNGRIGDPNKTQDPDPLPWAGW